MTATLRFYLFADDGLRRLSKRVMDGLIQGTDALPQYAGTKQRIAAVTLKNEDSHPIEIVAAEGSLLHFDASGQVRAGLQRAGALAVETYDNLERSRRKRLGAVVELGPQIRRQQWEREYRWEPSKEDLEAIAADIWGGSSGAVAAKTGSAKGIAPRRPALTRDAKYAMNEIAEHIFKIGVQLEQLSEKALEGLVSRAEEQARQGRAEVIWSGVAGSADYHRQVKARRRNGKGKWFAVIEALRTHPGGNVARIEYLAFEECSSKSAAEGAARRLLADSAKQFDQWTSIQAQLYCDLEWLPDETEVYDWPLRNGLDDIDENDVSPG